MKPGFLFSSLLVLLAGCGSREEGIRLHLQLTLRPQGSVQVDGNTRGFTTDRGDRVILTRADVSLDSVEIFPCPESSAWRWLHELSPVGTAYAHSASSPRRLGTPHVSSLESPDGAVLELGTLRPPPGRYCRIHLVFGPADADAQGLPADGAMVGRTFLLEGTVIPANGEGSHPFRLESARIANRELSLDALALSEDQLEAEQRITLSYDQWLDGASPLSPDAVEQVLRNVADSTAITAVQ
ncbi:hypothetical protein [Hyalangium versicolor]|uniref:hypothetical protein n=1 Tax=Hyalangium versicolor TaxID=2861190 RepID=UPI001CC921EF|nr:hypothetical protein [Hyalangium versicolor]